MEKGLLKGEIFVFKCVKGQPMNDETDFLSIVTQGREWSGFQLSHAVQQGA